MNTCANSGFTLVELMVVVVIIGLLTGIVGVNVLSAAKDGRETAALAQISALKGSVAMYYLAHGRYPASLEELTEAEPNRPHGYLEERALPDDPWGAAYLYDPAGDEIRPYRIWSAGADGLDGTDDDIPDES